MSSGTRPGVLNPLPMGQIQLIELSMGLEILLPDFQTCGEPWAPCTQSGIQSQLIGPGRSGIRPQCRELGGCSARPLGFSPGTQGQEGMTPGFQGSILAGGVERGSARLPRPNPRTQSWKRCKIRLPSLILVSMDQLQAIQLAYGTKSLSTTVSYHSSTKLPTPLPPPKKPPNSLMSQF